VRFKVTFQLRKGYSSELIFLTTAVNKLRTVEVGVMCINWPLMPVKAPSDVATGKDRLPDSGSVEVSAESGSQQPFDHLIVRAKHKSTHNMSRAGKLQPDPITPHFLPVVSKSNLAFYNFHLARLAINQSNYPSNILLRT